MTKIGVLSDTHGFLDQKVIKFFSKCDQIWHAGDIGNIKIADTLSEQKILKAVFGNIDGTDVRAAYKQHNRFICEDLDIWITHIGGYPDRYDYRVRQAIYRNPPNIFVCGHSHILKVINDPKINCLHINPGAAGNSGLHNVKTAIRFEIDKKNIQNLEILEIQRR